LQLITTDTVRYNTVRYMQYNNVTVYNVGLNVNPMANVRNTLDCANDTRPIV